MGRPQGVVEGGLRGQKSGSPLTGAVWSNLASAYALRTSDARSNASRVTESDGVLPTEVLICPPDEGQDSQTHPNNEQPPADGQAEEDDRSGRSQWPVSYTHLRAHETG